MSSLPLDPIEVSQLLRQQILGFDASASIEEVGFVLTVGDKQVNASVKEQLDKLKKGFNYKN